jgi:plasmid stabilization system protein ParE
MARIVWSRQAVEDLEAIIEYISRDSASVARRFARKIVARAEQLKRLPLSGGFVLEDFGRKYREVLHGSYRIIFRSDSKTVYIVAIRHSARLLDVSDLE